jgi:hypothetical protein
LVGSWPVCPKETFAENSKNKLKAATDNRFTPLKNIPFLKFCAKISVGTEKKGLKKKIRKVNDCAFLCLYRRGQKVKKCKCSNCRETQFANPLIDQLFSLSCFFTIRIQNVEVSDTTKA